MRIKVSQLRHTVPYKLIYTCRQNAISRGISLDCGRFSASWRWMGVGEETGVWRVFYKKWCHKNGYEQAVLVNFGLILLSDWMQNVIDNLSNSPSCAILPVSRDPREIICTFTSDKFSGLSCTLLRACQTCLVYRFDWTFAFANCDRVLWFDVCSMPRSRTSGGVLKNEV